MGEGERKLPGRNIGLKIGTEKKKKVKGLSLSFFP